MIPDAATSAILVIDFQERFVPAIKNMPALLPKLAALLGGAKELSVPVIVTEQYPKGLGKTVPEVARLLPEGWTPVEKTCFSCFSDEKFRAELVKLSPKSLAIAGIETHICVLQTALHAIQRGYKVFIIADCVASRSDFDRDVALEFLGKAGARIISMETYLFMLLKDSTNPAFKAVSKLVK